MKTHIHLIKISVLILGTGACFFSSCQDGLPGTSYFRVTDANNTVTSFSCNDPNLPSTFSWNTYYPTKAGTYAYDYWQYAIEWSGTYVIVENPGEKWDGLSDGILIAGADGKDRHYTFDCDAASGSELSYYNGKTINHDIVINKTFHFQGGTITIKGKGVYHPEHLNEPQAKDLHSIKFTTK